MVLPEACGGGLGVLDFQDALWGPASYDLASLLRDAYVDWPEAVQLDAAIRYWEAARKAGLPVPERFDALWRDMEWMAVQRGLKVLGIFARLNHRDGKPRYLQDLPRVLTQVRATAGRYDALAPLARCLDRLHDRAVQTAYTF
jgi:aminoglycoside/choline kinase family phosphotransferase